MTMRLVQLTDGRERWVAVVEEPRVRAVEGFASVYELALAAIERGISLTELAGSHATGQSMDYDEVYAGTGQRKLLAPFDQPQEPSRCLVSGTGLTHLGSAKNRQAMHGVTESETDSMRMFRWGVEGGRPAAGEIGISPEWFYKGTGDIVQAPGQPLWIPNYGEDGGEEAELAGLYVIAPSGEPWRVGMAAGNEFSDHRFEKKNYLNLASSKIRQCGLGPELVVGADFQRVEGEARIERGAEIVWSKAVATGEAEMCHSLENIEHHHFKFASHRRPGDAHVHYFGAHSLSFGDGVVLADGDVMVIQYQGFGRALRNPVRVERELPRVMRAKTLR